MENAVVLWPSKNVFCEIYPIVASLLVFSAFQQDLSAYLCFITLAVNRRHHRFLIFFSLHYGHFNWVNYCHGFKSQFLTCAIFQLFRNLTCLNNSIGGWAPYFSLDGMLRSSTNTTHFLPGGGPYTPLRRLQWINMARSLQLACQMTLSLLFCFQFENLIQEIRL